MSNSSCPGARRFSLSNCVLLHTSVGCIAAAMLRLRGAILKRSTVAPEGRQDVVNMMEKASDTSFAAVIGG